MILEEKEGGSILFYEPTPTPDERKSSKGGGYMYVAREKYCQLKGYIAYEAF